MLNSRCTSADAISTQRPEDHQRGRQPCTQGGHYRVQIRIKINLKNENYFTGVLNESGVEIVYSKSHALLSRGFEFVDLLHLPRDALCEELGNRSVACVNSRLVVALSLVVPDCRGSIFLRLAFLSCSSLDLAGGCFE